MSVTDDIRKSDTTRDRGRPAHRRPIRSFVRREGRLTPAQARALRELWPIYGVDHPGAILDPIELFGRRAPLTLEIGFGNGEALLSAARAYPERDYLGVEVHRPGVGRLLNRLHAEKLGNVRVICADAVEVLRDRVRPETFDACWIFFPDPWPKKRHHKRRLIQPEFATTLVAALRDGGILHLATDWEDYAEHMLEVLDNTSALSNTAGRSRYAERPEWRPETRFERRGQIRGHKVFDLIYRKVEADD